MTQQPRDVDLAGWLDGIAYHGPVGEAGPLAHEAARGLVGGLGQILWQILPPGRDKGLAFTHLEDALMRANRALALNGGPREHVTAQDLRDLIEYGRVFSDADEERLAAAQVTRGGRFVIPEDPDEASALLDLYNEAVNARHPGIGYTPAQAGAVEPPDLEPDEEAPRGYYLDARKRRTPIPADDALLTSSMRGFGNSAGMVVGLSGTPGLTWAPGDYRRPDISGVPEGYRSPFQSHGHAGDHHAMRFPGPAVDGIRGHVPVTAEQDAEARRLAESIPPISAAALADLTGLTPAAAEVTPATVTGGVPDAAPTDEAPHTIWSLTPSRGKTDTDLGITQGAGFVGLAILGGVRAPLVHSPHTGASGYGVRLETLDAVNLVLETLAAAAGRAFAEE